MSNLQTAWQDLETLRYNSRKEDILVEDVYHYTYNCDGLIGILKTQQLFMRDYRDLHQGEIKHTLECLKDRISEKKLKNTINYEETELHSFWQSFEWYYNHLRIFLLSFSLSRDNPYLWRIFGGNGEGFSIRFCKDYFNSAFSDNPPPQSKPEEMVMVTKVCYEDKGKEKLLAEFSQLINKIRDNVDMVNKKDYQKNLIEIFARIIPWLPKFLCTDSHRETEFRCFTQDLDHNKKRIPDELIVTLPGKNGVPMNGIYMKDKIPIKYIKEILIGYKLDFCKMETKIRKNLKKEFPNGEFDNIEITRSKV